MDVIHVWEDIGIAATDDQQLRAALAKFLPSLGIFEKQQASKKEITLASFLHFADLLLAAFIPRECSYAAVGRNKPENVLYFFKRRQLAIAG